MALNRAITLSSHEREQKGIARGQSMEKEKHSLTVKAAKLIVKSKAERARVSF